MTTLRFIGELPLWFGLLLAMCISTVSWLYYQRDCKELSRRLRWILPSLRSMAFFLGVIVLTGPVLHHKQITGEPGKVTILIDQSESMSLRDRHMSLSRKFLIAEQQGWLSSGVVDHTVPKIIQGLNDAVQQAGNQVHSLPPEASVLPESLQDQKSSRERTTAMDQIRRNAATALNELPVELRASLTAELLARAERLVNSNPAPIAADSLDGHQKALEDAIETAYQLQTEITRLFENQLTTRIQSSDPALKSAIAMFDESSRWDRLIQLINRDNADLLKQLSAEHEVQIFAVTNSKATDGRTGKRLLPWNTVDGIQPGPTSDKLGDFSPVTDLATPLSLKDTSATATDPDAQAPARDNTPKSTVILMTDGQHNAGPSAIRAAQILKTEGSHLFTVAVGADQPATDLAVTSVEHPDSVFRTDDVHGTLVLKDRMPAGQPMVIELTHGNTVVWREELLSQNLSQRRVDFQFNAKQIAESVQQQSASDINQHVVPVELTARIIPQRDEAEIRNNAITMRLALVMQSQRILILDGRSRWETRYLRNVFDRDEQWFVNTVIPGNPAEASTLPRGKQPGQFPLSRDELFGYDVVVFGDISPELFESAELKWIREFVELRGGGIIFIDGQRQSLRRLSEADLQSLLPIEWTGLADVTSIPSDSKWQLNLTEAGSEESAFSLQTDAQNNRQFWSELPGPHVINQVLALPGSTTLVSAVTVGNSNPVPAIVTRQFGAGRVLYLAFDETWRWRYKAADTWHQKIWNQLARMVMPPVFASSDEYLSIDTGAVSYQSGAPVDIRIRLKNPDGSPATALAPDALLSIGNRIVSEVSLTEDTRVPGVYRGRATGLADGDYEVSVRASGFTQAALKARGRFTVLPVVSGEMTETSANESLLHQMAFVSGGTFLREEQLSELPDRLRPFSHGKIIESETEIWQTYWWFSAIIALLTAEWALRKRAGLL
ncbi:MAG: VWA domain-containing protein [Planctomycetaceae bacterium]